MANLQVGVAGNGTVTVGAGASVHSPASNTLTLGTNNSERLRISSSGLVGIGTDGPDNMLHIRGATANQIIVETTTNTSYGMLKFREGDHDGTKDKYIIGYNDSHTAQADELSIKNQIGDITFMTGGVATTDERLRIDSSGRVGVGTATPDALLHLGADSATAQLKMQRTNEAANTNDYGRIYWESYSGTLTGQLSVARESAENDGYMLFKTASSGTLTERLRITSGGQTLATGSMRLQNSGNVSFNIRDTSGNAVSNWLEIDSANALAIYNCYKEGVGTKYPHVFKGYTTEYARIDDAGIKFNGDTATANALDDYEEGTFTPTLTGGSTAGSPTYQHQAGWYTKVGNLVTLNVNLATTNTGSGAGNMRIGALPFTCSSNTEGIGAVQYNQLGSGLPSGREGPAFAIIQNPNTYCDIRVNDSGSTNYTHMEIQTVSYMRVTIQYQTA